MSRALSLHIDDKGMILQWVLVSGKHIGKWYYNILCNVVKDINV